MIASKLLNGSVCRLDAHFLHFFKASSGKNKIFRQCVYVCVHVYRSLQRTELVGTIKICIDETFGTLTILDHSVKNVRKI